MPKIISIGISDFTLPDTSSQVMDSALPMNMSSVGSSGAGVGNGGGKGPGNGLGNGPGDGLGMGPGIGKGFMTPFGSSTAGAGSMPGRFYDFKQMPDGKPTKGYSISNSEDFTSRVNKIQDSGYRETAFRKFFQAPDTLYLTQLAIPVTDANAGPKFFNVEGKVKPSGWFVHYEGAVRCDRDITFRFVGIGDDYLAVYSNNRPRVIAPWPQTRTQVIGRWDPSEPIADRSAPSPLPGGPMGKGDWVRLKKGELLDLDIGLGESPGGKVGFVLMIEEKDAPYRTASNGEKILPLFTTEPITKTARDRITKDFPNWEFEWDGVPVFAVDKASGMGADLR